MKKPTKLLVIAGSILLLLTLAFVLFPRVTYVDQRPAVAFGNEYFSKLKQAKVDDAFGMYTDGFLEKRGDDWRKLLTSLDSQNGAVSSFKILASSLAPVTLRDSTEIPCVLVRYEVRRNTLISGEKLTICPHQRGAEYGIAGHEITRSDSGQHFSAGLTIQERKIVSTN